jgi:ESF2/ABP1 family protein
VELSQSRAEQKDYLKNVELARVLEKRAERKREKGEEFQFKPNEKKRPAEDQPQKRKKPRKEESGNTGAISNVLDSIF